MVRIGEREIPTTEAVLMGTGALMLVDGFLPWYGVQVFTYSVHVTGFSAGFAWIPVLLVTAVGAAAAARVLLGQRLPSAGSLGPNALLLAGSAAGTLLVVLRLLTQSSFTTYGIYLGLLLAAGQTAVAYLALRASGEPVPTLHRGATQP